MLNNVVLVGRMTKDPELRYTPNNQAVATFSLAVNRNFKGQNGEREADFINCVAWEKTGETIAEYFRKGSQIGVQGRLSVRSYEQNGENKWIAEVIVEKFDFIGSNNPSNGGGSYSHNNSNNNYNSSNYNNNNNYNNSHNHDNQSQHSDNKPFAGNSGNSDDSDEDFPF